MTCLARVLPQHAGKPKWLCLCVRAAFIHVCCGMWICADREEAVEDDNCQHTEVHIDPRVKMKSIFPLLSRLLLLKLL